MVQPSLDSSEGLEGAEPQAQISHRANVES